MDNVTARATRIEPRAEHRDVLVCGGPARTLLGDREAEEERIVHLPPTRERDRIVVTREVDVEVGERGAHVRVLGVDLEDAFEVRLGDAEVTNAKRILSE